MTVHRVSKVALLLASLGLVSIGSAGPSIAATEVKSPAVLSSPGQSSVEDQKIRACLAELTKALTEADAKAEASLWTEDGIFVDDDGKEWKGRTQLQERFSSIFSEDGKQMVDLVPTRIKMLSDNVALAQGIVQDKRVAGQAVPSTHFSIMLLKQKGSWLISMATEAPILAHPDAQPLKALDWLIGDWSTERNGKGLRIKYQWMSNKHCIRAQYGLSDTKDPEKEEVQIIGWDPRNQQIISWSFDANGGFGRSVWFKKDNKWMIDKTSVGSDGSETKSMHVLSLSNPNSYSWQSVGGTIDGVAIPDSAQLIVQRSGK